MLALRLVHLIESHSEQLSAKLLHTFQTSEKCSDLRKVPPDELRERTREICRNISDWLTAKTEKDIERRYTELGARRTAQGVALSHFIWAIGATREHIHDFLLDVVEDRADIVSGSRYLPDSVAVGEAPVERREINARVTAERAYISAFCA